MASTEAFVFGGKMNIEIGIDPLAVDTIKRAAHRFCEQNNIDVQDLKNQLKVAYDNLNCDKTLTYANVLKSMSKKMLEEANTGSVPPIVAELFNNWYLAFAVIEEVDQEHRSDAELDDLFNGYEKR